MTGNKVRPLERRNVEGTCEIRTGEAGKPVIAGYGAVFNSWSQNLGGFVEQIDSRAFDKTIQEADVRALANHDPNWLLGRRGNNTLRLSTDTRGVHYEIDVNMSDPDGQRALAKVERGDWDGASFGFRTIRDSWNTSAAPRERALLEVQLRDIGPVTYPAYLETTSHAEGAARSLAQELGVEYRDVAQAMEANKLDDLLAARQEQPPEARERIVLNTTVTTTGGGTWTNIGSIGSASTTGEVRAAGDLAWAPEDGFQDLCDDVTMALNDPDDFWGRYYCFDAATSLDRVLVADMEECTTYVVPITIGDDQEPVVSAPEAWIPVETGWVEVDLARSFALSVEERAGKMLSADSVGRINQAISMLQKLITDAEAGTDGSGDVPGDGDGGRGFAADAEARLRELQGPRRYAPGTLAA